MRRTQTEIGSHAFEKLLTGRFDARRPRIIPPKIVGVLNFGKFGAKQ
jgi:hypothetical protein